MAVSHFETVNRHLQTRGASAPMTDNCDDLDMIVRRCDMVRALGEEFGGVELSPYIQSVIGVTREATRRRMAEDVRMVVSV
jgi:hypothetical protein